MFHSITRSIRRLVYLTSRLIDLKGALYGRTLRRADAPIRFRLGEAARKTPWKIGASFVSAGRDIRGILFTS